MRALPVSAVRSPDTLTEPPVWPAFLPLASSVPDTSTSPPSPSRTMSPPCCSTRRAWTVPDMLTTRSTSPLAAEAVIRTRPPSAKILPLLLTRAATGLPSAPTGRASVLASTAMLIFWSPNRSTTKRRPDASVTSPMRAWMVPRLATPGATSAASPACATVMLPSFSTVAVEPARPSKLWRPAMKSSLRMSWVVATSPPTSTLAFGPNRMPFGLTSQTCPLAVSRPMMAEGSGPVTRLRVMELASGCWKLVCSPSAMPKRFQSITAFGVDWMTSSRPGPVDWMTALPSVTTPPSGLAKAGRAGRPRAATAAMTARRAAPASAVPRHRACLSPVPGWSLRASTACPADPSVTPDPRITDPLPSASPRCPWEGDTLSVFLECETF